MHKITSYIVALVSAVVLLSSCEKEYESIETVDQRKIEEYIQKNNLQNVEPDGTGAYYQIIEQGTGDFLKNTDLVFYNFDIQSLDGTVYQSASPLSNNGTYVGYVTSPAAFRPVMLKVKRGAKVKLIIPSYLAFGKNGSGNIPSNEVIISNLTIFSESTQAEIDDNRISAFLLANGISAIKHTSGVYYQELTAGTGTDIIDEHSTLTVKYSGKLLDGTQFDSSDSFSTKLPAVIPGWGEVIPLFKAGAKVRIFIPSGLGYGTAGGGTIPVNAVLDFTIEITTVAN